MYSTIVERLKNDFLERFGDEDGLPGIWFAPGRVNLIGEHTDYNDGFVLPASIGYGTYLAARLNRKGLIRLVSLNMEGNLEISAGARIKKQSLQWANYPLGVMIMMAGHGALPGVDMLFFGDIPPAAGLSSSASIEMVTASAIRDLLNTDHSVTELALLSKRAENEFVGVSCGIMDQFAVGMGQEGGAIFLDCRSLDHEFVPIDRGGFAFMIINSGKSRELAASKYNERVAECRAAVKQISKFREISSLRDANSEDLDILKSPGEDDLLLQRARHVVTENQRVLQSVEMLHNNDLEGFGRLMYVSHRSLREDYEVTGKELDLLVELSLECGGVAGARMTGAGFGGCTVNLVRHENVNDLKHLIHKEYVRATGLTPEFYLPRLGAGMKRII